jgi:hypothetical protein
MQADTIQVPQDHSTIQGAINSANAGDTVLIDQGIYFEKLVINKPLHLEGVGTGGSRPVISWAGKNERPWDNPGFSTEGNQSPDVSYRGIIFDTNVLIWLSGHNVFVDCQFNGFVAAAVRNLAFINCLFDSEVELQGNYGNQPFLLQNCTLTGNSKVVVQNYVNLPPLQFLAQVE